MCKDGNKDGQIIDGQIERELGKSLMCRDGQIIDIELGKSLMCRDGQIIDVELGKSLM